MPQFGSSSETSNGKSEPLNVSNCSAFSACLGREPSVRLSNTGPCSKFKNYDFFRWNPFLAPISHSKHNEGHQVPRIIPVYVVFSDRIQKVSSRYPYDKSSLSIWNSPQLLRQGLAGGSSTNTLKQSVSKRNSSSDSESLSFMQLADDISNACKPCHEMKLKCDFKRPCFRCIRRGRPEECVERQSFSRRKGVVRLACSECAKAKRKCEDKRPCTRCVRLGKESLCLEYNETEAELKEKG